MPDPGEKNDDGSRVYGACWGCGKEGFFVRFLSGHLLCYECDEAMKRADARRAGDAIAAYLRRAKAPR